MTVQERLDCVLDIEDRFDVNEWHVDGILIWPLVRAQFITIGTNLIKHKVSIWNLSIVRLLKQFFSTLHLFLSKKECKHLVVTTDRKRKKDGSHEFIDYLTKKTGISKDTMFAFESNNSKSMVLPEENYSVYHLIYFYSLCMTIGAKLKGSVYLKDIEKVRQYLKVHNPKVAFAFDPKRVTKMALRLSASIGFMRRILKRRKVENVLMESYYSIYNFSICAAADLEKIPVIEFQHGVQGKSHLAYGSFSRVPKEGYKIVPDIFWVWNKDYASHIKVWADNTSKHRVYVGGYTGLIPEAFKKQKSGNKILFTLQPIEDCIPIALSEFIVSNHDFEWYFRLHPKQKSEKQKLVNELDALGIREKIDIDSLNEISILDALASVDLHITLWSSCVIEANIVGTPSIVFHENGKAMYEDKFEELNVQYLEQLNREVFLLNMSRNKDKQDAIEVQTNLSDILESLYVS